MTFVIADYQDITRLGIVSLIKETFGDKTQAATADTLPALSSLLDGEESVSVVIVDCIGRDNLDMFHIDDIQELSNKYPHIIWVLFSNEIPETVARRFAAESRFSLLLKSAHTEEIVSALRLASVGEHFICHGITNILLSNTRHSEALGELTETELKILKLTALGKSVKEIANERNSSCHTITTHKRNIFRKLGVNSSTEVTRYAIRAGLVDLVEYYI